MSLVLPVQEEQARIIGWSVRLPGERVEYQRWRGGAEIPEGGRDDWGAPQRASGGSPEASCELLEALGDAG